MHIGTKIRLIRKHTNFTQKKLAERSGVACAMICAYEQGKHEPPYFTVECLLNAMGYKLKVVKDDGEDDDI
jgi:transcriptional regulator with XRE-family HTH domain